MAEIAVKRGNAMRVTGLPPWLEAQLMLERSRREGGEADYGAGTDYIPRTVKERGIIAPIAQFDDDTFGLALPGLIAGPPEAALDVQANYRPGPQNAMLNEDIGRSATIAGPGALVPAGAARVAVGRSVGELGATASQILRRSDAQKLISQMKADGKSPRQIADAINERFAPLLDEGEKVDKYRAYYAAGRSEKRPAGTTERPKSGETEFGAMGGGGSTKPARITAADIEALGPELGVNVDTRTGKSGTTYAKVYGDSKNKGVEVRIPEEGVPHSSPQPKNWMIDTSAQPARTGQPARSQTNVAGEAYEGNLAAVKDRISYALGKTPKEALRPEPLPEPVDPRQLALELQPQQRSRPSWRGNLDELSELASADVRRPAADIIKVWRIRNPDSPLTDVSLETYVTRARAEAYGPAAGREMEKSLALPSVQDLIMREHLAGADTAVIAQRVGEALRLEPGSVTPLAISQEIGKLTGGRRLGVGGLPIGGIKNDIPASDQQAMSNTWLDQLPRKAQVDWQTTVERAPPANAMSFAPEGAFNKSQDRAPVNTSSEDRSDALAQSAHNILRYNGPEIDAQLAEVSGRLDYGQTMRRLDEEAPQPQLETFLNNVRGNVAQLPPGFVLDPPNNNAMRSQ